MIARRTPLRRTTFRTDPVTLGVRLNVLTRDGGCVAVLLGESPAACRGRLQLDHVKDQPRMGKRAPSDERHLIAVCEFHHLEGWATSHRPLIRSYLVNVQGASAEVAALIALGDCRHVEKVHGCPLCMARA